MRALSEIIGKLVLWAALLWIGAIFVAPADLRPVLACQPVVWVTRSLASVAGAGGGEDRAAMEQSDALGNFSQGCARVMRDYFALGGARS